jgi:hypothetical protein
MDHVDAQDGVGSFDWPDVRGRIQGDRGKNITAP